MTEYVAGFLYSPDGEEVALIRKQKPDWQKGKLNGIGGKIEEGESPLQAMIREYEEETGCNITDWRFFLSLNGEWGRVYFYSATGDLSKLQSMEDEQVEIHFVCDMPHLPTIPNLRWIVPMGIDKDEVGGEIHEFSNTMF